MSHKEEKLLAIQNIGACAFIIGLLFAGMAGNEFTFILFSIVLMAGVIDVCICDILLDKLKNRKEQKNKGSVTDQSTEPLS